VYALFVPSPTPRAIVSKPNSAVVTAVDQLNAELNRMLQQADMRERLQNNGLVPIGSTPAELREYLMMACISLSRYALPAQLSLKLSAFCRCDASCSLKAEAFVLYSSACF
jgi:hypothetical protein